MAGKEHYYLSSEMEAGVRFNTDRRTSNMICALRSASTHSPAIEKIL